MKIADEVLSLLNSAVLADMFAMNRLVKNREAVNRTLENHPTIRCGRDPVTNNVSVGMLGIINGLIAGLSKANGEQDEPICACWDTKTGELIRFAKVSEVAENNEAV